MDFSGQFPHTLGNGTTNEEHPKRTRIFQSPRRVENRVKVHAIPCTQILHLEIRLRRTMSFIMDVGQHHPFSRDVAFFVQDRRRKCRFSDQRTVLIAKSESKDRLNPLARKAFNIPCLATLILPFLVGT